MAAELSWKTEPNRRETETAARNTNSAERLRSAVGSKEVKFMPLPIVLTSPYFYRVRAIGNEVSVQRGH